MFWRNRVNLKRALTATGGGAAQCAVTAQSCAVGIGHSHLMAFVYAQQGRIEQEQPLKTHLHWILLQDDEFNPNLVTKGGRTALNPALQKRLDAELASLPQAPPFLYASISGNEYLYVGHTEHPRPFDFCLPERPELQVRSGVEIIPPSLMRKTLERSMENALAIMGALREATDLPIVFIQSPPPVFSNDHIREHPGPFKESKICGPRASSPSTVWRKEMPVVPPPPVAQVGDAGTSTAAVLTKVFIRIKPVTFTGNFEALSTLSCW